MADAVTKIVLHDTPTHHIVHLTNISDGTGEAAVVKVDKSAIAVASDGAEAASLDVVDARWNVQGMTSVRILWDHTTDDVGLVLAGSGYETFEGRGGLPGISGAKALADPRSSGGAGDILLTTNGAVAGGSYDITLTLRKQPD